MRKLFSPFVGLCLLFFLLSACSSMEEATDAMDLSEEFIDTLYTVDNADFVTGKTSAEEIIDIQNEYKPYLTEDEFEELSAKRLLSLPNEIASQLKNTISVEKIELEHNQQTEDEKDSVDLNHSFTLVFKDEAENKVDKIEMTGQMTVIETKDGPKISRYHDTDELVEMYAP
ncbi:MAG TPA: hypothetical protein VK094_08510 [Pseudogracilibacillus sp.]|nr:hypothetical protein [Pseudogracilibacillus sp.]